eukprot:gb/GEZN01001817.1/.p1 GENE.gb/GEZN01001817.1/~~gb/GEZN01001817.1/.p1  ORF type:complete len:839 (-),score=120.28 gb/GEZN01001817.1/:288-2729(-)
MPGRGSVRANPGLKASSNLPTDVPPFFMIMLRKVPWLIVNDRDVHALAKLLHVEKYAKGHVIRNAGEPEAELVVVQEGEVEVSTPPGFPPTVYQGVQKKNFQFGTSIFSKTEKKAAFTAIAHTEVQAWVLTKKAYINHGRKARKRFVVASAPVNLVENKSRPSTVPVLIKKTDEEKALILAALKRCELLSSLHHNVLAIVAAEMDKNKIPEGKEVITQGEFGDTFYICSKGILDVFIDGAKVAQKHKGDFFGELALMHDAVRSATVKAAQACELFCIKSELVRVLVARHAFKENETRVAFLRKVPLLQTLKPAQLNHMAECLSERTYLKGESVVKQGADGSEFFIVQSGDLSITVEDRNAGMMLEVGSYRPGDYFGELALLGSGKRAATVCAKDLCVCLSLKKADFEQILGEAARKVLESKSEEYKATTKRVASASISHQDLSAVREATADSSSADAKDVKETIAEEGNASDVEVEKPHPRPKVKKIPHHLEVKSMTELEVLGTLGRGAFGHVRLVRDKKGAVHALKTLNKHLLVETQQVEHVQNELAVMSELSSQFVVEFRGWFQDANHLHLLMQPSLGGELGTLLEEKEQFNEEEAKFSAACMILGFEHIHSLGMVYRDLKPENLLLEPSGYLKIVDFGFAKQIGDERTFTVCGTPEYLSPEVISGKGHGCATDFWSLGIVLFELLTGETPYYDSNPMATYQVIMRSKDVPWPDADDLEISETAKGFVEALLNKSAPLRLGANGTDDIKVHQWFSADSYSWPEMQTRTMPSPFPLKVSGEADMSRFTDALGEDDRWKEFSFGDGPDPFQDF